MLQPLSSRGLVYPKAGMKRGCNTRIALLATKHVPLVPSILPARCSQFGGHQPCNWKLLKKHSAVFSQNRFRGQQPARPSLWKNVKLPFLGLQAAPVWSKGGRCPDSSSNARSRYSYVHFSSPVQFAAKPPPRKIRHNQRPCADPALQGLKVRGTTCVPTPRVEASLPPCVRRPKMEIHVYVPKVKECLDAESLDEGFLEDMDNQMSALGLQDPNL